MTADNNRDTGAASRIALQVKRVIKAGDVVLLRVVTTSGESTISSWEYSEIGDDTNVWAQSVSDFAQDDADAAGVTSNYVVIVERDGRAVNTQRMRRTPKDFQPEEEKLPALKIIDTLTKHIEAIHKSLVTITTSPHQPLINVVESLTKRVVEVESKRSDMVDEVTRTRFLVSEMARELKEDSGIELDEKMMERLEKIGNRAMDMYELKVDLEKMKLQESKGS